MEFRDEPLPLLLLREIVDAHAGKMTPGVHRRHPVAAGLPLEGDRAGGAGQLDGAVHGVVDVVDEGLAVGGGLAGEPDDERGSEGGLGLLGGLVLIVGTGLVLLYSLGHVPETRQRYERITVGMTYAEVEQLLIGGRVGDQQCFADDAVRGVCHPRTVPNDSDAAIGKPLVW